MNSLIALAFALTVLSPNLLAQTEDMKMPMTGNVETQVTALDKQGILAVKANDPSFMEKYLADDYVGISGRGQQMDRQTSIDNLKTGKTKYDTLEILEHKVTQYGPSAAIARGKVMVKGMFSGQPNEGTYAFSRTWLQRDGKWQVVAFQSTKIQ